MPSPTIVDLDKRIARIPQHAQALPQESDSPIEHYRRGSLDALSLVQYFHRNMGRVNVYRVPYERHSAKLHAMTLLTLVETFERFLKELAAVCVDHISGLVVDDRLARFTANGTAIALTFGQGTVGRLLCESLLWTDVNTIDDRFKKILDEESLKPFSLFPTSKSDPDLWLTGVLDKIYQGDNTLFDPQERADRLSKAFRRPVTVAGVTGSP